MEIKKCPWVQELIKNIKKQHATFCLLLAYFTSHSEKGDNLAQKREGKKANCESKVKLIGLENADWRKIKACTKIMISNLEQNSFSLQKQELFIETKFNFRLVLNFSNFENQVFCLNAFLNFKNEKIQLICCNICTQKNFSTDTFDQRDLEYYLQEIVQKISKKP